MTKGQGHTTRSKVTDVEVSAFSECFLFFFFFTINRVNPFRKAKVTLVTSITKDVKLIKDN